MSKDLQNKIFNQMAYGAISRGQIPLDLEDYSVSLVKQHFKNSPPQLKLKFTSNMKSQSNSQFYIKIDDVREPANAMILIKYYDSEGKVIARPVNKIKKKLILSVQKQANQHEVLVQDSSSQEDSDIPKKPLYKFKFLLTNEDSDNEGRPRKRVKLTQEQKDQESES